MAAMGGGREGVPMRAAGAGGCNRQHFSKPTFAKHLRSGSNRKGTGSRAGSTNKGNNETQTFISNLIYIFVGFVLFVFVL